MLDHDIGILHVDGYSEYLREVLGAEGWKSVSMVQPEELAAALSSGKGLLIVGAAPHAPRQIRLISEFARRGGNLVAFKPGLGLCPALGVALEGGSEAPALASGGYLRIADAEPCEGLEPFPMQIHDDAIAFGLTGGAKAGSAATGIVLARLCDAQGRDSGFPAVTFCETANGGSAAAFAFDLARSIHRTRQGNFELAGRETDGIDGLRPADMFVDGWVDASLNLKNQADEQMRLLSRIIERMLGREMPLPRLHYFPDGADACVVLSNDSEYSSGAQIGAQLDEIRAAGGRMTVYLFKTDEISREQVEAWVAQGHEMAAHPGLLDGAKHGEYARDPSWEKASARVAEKVAEVGRLYGLKPRTCVNHWFVWCGRDESGAPDPVAMARIFEKNGIVMESHHTHYDLGGNQDGFLGGRAHPGNFTGSGLPMKLADPSGRPLGVYQLANPVYDQEYTEREDPEGFFACFAAMLEASLGGGAPSWIHVKAHNDEWWFSREPVLRMLALARERGVAAVTMEKCLDFTLMRDEARIEDLNWDGRTLSFTMASSIDAGHALTLLLPSGFDGRKLSRVLVDGAAARSTAKVVKGRPCAAILLRGGRRSAVAAEYESASKADR